MEYFLLIFIVCFGVLLIGLDWQFSKRKDFRKLIEPQLEKFGIKYIKSEYPVFLKVGPFKKFEIEIKPQINNGAIQYEKTYYRKVTVSTNKRSKVEIWAKIETGWFKEDSVEFSPELKNVK